MVSITGDTATGKRVAKIAAETVKRLHLELGGKAPVIIFDDADLDLAAETLKAAGYWNAGQDCTAATRVLAGPEGLRRASSTSSPTRSARSSGATRPRPTTSTWARSSRRPRPTRSQGMVDRARGRRRGRRRRQPAGPAGRLLRADAHRRRGPEVRDHPGRDLRAGRHRPAVQRRGAGDRLGERHAVRPRVSLFTSDIGRAMRVSKALEFGHVWINEHFTLASETPHGGVKQSGWGKDGSKYALEDYTFIKHVMINTDGRRRPTSPGARDLAERTC